MIIASFEYSINFIDPLDVFVGYDDTSSCCEDFGWLFLPKPYHEMTTELIGSAGGWSEYGDSLDYSMCMFGNDEKKIVKELENYVFDTTTKVEGEGEAAGRGQDGDLPVTWRECHLICVNFGIVCIKMMPIQPRRWYHP